MSKEMQQHQLEGNHGKRQPRRRQAPHCQGKVTKQLWKGRSCHEIRTWRMKGKKKVSMKVTIVPQRLQGRAAAVQ